MTHSSALLQKKTVVITGASSGIGHASVQRLLQAGWRVFATVRKLEDATRLQSENPRELIPDHGRSGPPARLPRQRSRYLPISTGEAWTAS